MATFTNQNKNTSTLTNVQITGKTQWSASFITWAEAGIGWGALKSVVYTPQTKNASVMTNQTKN